MVLNTAVSIPSLTQLTNLIHLELEMASKTCLRHNALAGCLLGLLESSWNLVHLEVTRLSLPADRLSEALKRNRNLKSLKIHGCLDVNETTIGIVEALSLSNGTLTNAEVTGENSWVSSHYRKQLQYYMALNKIGRGVLMSEDTANMSALMQILGILERARNNTITSALRYGILRQLPSLWSGEFTGDDELIIFDEDALADASPRLVLGR